MRVIIKMMMMMVMMRKLKYKFREDMFDPEA